MRKKIVLFIMTATFLLGGCTSSEDVTENSYDASTEAADFQTQPTEDIVPDPVTPADETFDSGTPYGNTKRYIEFLGLKEYATLGSGSMKDTPADGNVFLVLFLKIENRTNSSDYINPYYVFADVDGTKTENTSLLNDPEGYRTVFSEIEPLGEVDGFVVWEVPKNWKELNLDFNTWENSDHLDLHATFTRDDLKDPVPAEERKEPE